MTEARYSGGAAADAMVGRTIGHYTLRHKLAEGATGAVYVAEHPWIGKRVALKILHLELASQPEIVSRFFNEAKAVNDIQHPNIVDIIDFGVVEGTSPIEPAVVYLLMEYLEGESLGHLIRREAPLPPERALAIALQIADALSASHHKGIVHRDLKPDNIMLVSRGRERDFVKVLDFGLAKLTLSATSSHRTRTGVVIGTPQYMSPEQCEGRSDIDHRTDIYGLGIVLYEMLTGRVPFRGEGFAEVLVQQLAMPPLAPSALVAGIPEHVERAVLRALEKRVDDRYLRMVDMALALQAPVSSAMPRAAAMPGPAHTAMLHVDAPANVAPGAVLMPSAARTLMLQVDAPPNPAPYGVPMPSAARTLMLNVDAMPGAVPPPSAARTMITGGAPTRRGIGVKVALAIALAIALVGAVVGIAARRLDSAPQPAPAAQSSVTPGPDGTGAARVRDCSGTVTCTVTMTTDGDVSASVHGT